MLASKLIRKQMEQLDKKYVPESVKKAITNSIHFVDNAGRKMSLNEFWTGKPDNADKVETIKE